MMTGADAAVAGAAGRCGVAAADAGATAGVGVAAGTLAAAATRSTPFFASSVPFGAPSFSAPIF